MIVVHWGGNPGLPVRIILLGIRKRTMPRVASCATNCWHHDMHPVLHAVGSPGCIRGQGADRAPPADTGGGLGPPNEHVAIIFASKSVARTNWTAGATKSDCHPGEWSLCLQQFPKDQPRLPRESWERGYTTGNLSLDRAVRLQPSYLCLQNSYTNSTNLGAVVSLTW